MSEPANCPICGAKLIRVQLFARHWDECPNSVMEGLLPLWQIREIMPDHIQHNPDLEPERPTP